MIGFHPLRLNPPDQQNSLRVSSSMGDDTPFVVRPLPSTGLDGAFRVHLAPEALEKLGLKVGELCQINGEHGGLGNGIAWRATDKMGNSPKLRPAKMTDTLRTAFGFKEGSHVTISRTPSRLLHADKVILTDVTPSEYGNGPESESRPWRTKCAGLLVDCEAIATGTTFDVIARKGLRKRFYVDHIQGAGTQTGTPALFVCDDNTQVAFTSDGVPTAETALPTGDSFPMLDTTRIGGLVEQVKELNRRLDSILDRSAGKVKVGNGISPDQHVLIYGYEGTGKSMLLNRLEQTSACKVSRLEKADMTTGKAQATIQNTFKEAIAQQPSIILMDDLEELASSDNKLYSRVLGRELDKLSDANVLVVAATRSTTDIDSNLFGPERFSAMVELPIPDVTARKQILNVLLRSPADGDDALTTAIGMKTHGFTGKDLGLLVKVAAHNAYHRRADERNEWVEVRARASMPNGVLDGQVDGSVHSGATTQVETATPLASPPIDGDAEERALQITMEDFELALTKVRPTALREIFFETPKVQWSDIGGSETNKQRFDEIIGWPLHHADVMAKFDIQPQKGVLLYGPPGCSKTMTAQAVAATYDLNFIAVKGAELISMYVGESERAVREVFRKARQAAPCIVFFDEIDAIGSERESGGAKGLNVLTTLLNEMDGFEAMRDVLVLAATNKPEVLDPALLRPGRFDQHVYVGLPNEEARRDILEISLKKLPLAAEVDMSQLVVSTEGYSGAEVVAVCRVAQRCASRREITTGEDANIGAGDFERAIGETRRGVTEEMLGVYEAFAAR